MRLREWIRGLGGFGMGWCIGEVCGGSPEPSVLYVLLGPGVFIFLEE